MQSLQPVQRGKCYTIEISGLGHSGEGVGRYEGFTVFVPYALPGETVKAQIVEVKKKYAKGKLVGLVRPSADRTKAPCTVYHLCGGCQLQHLRYEAQLQVKQQQVADAMQRIGGLEDVLVHPVLGAEDPWHYRNKMQVPAGRQNGKTVLGCFVQGSHEIVDMEHCLIQSAANNEIVQTVRKILRELQISSYDETTGKGVIRHILGRTGTMTGEVMVVLVTNGEEFPQREAVVLKLRQSITGIVSIQQNSNTRRTNVILGEKTILLWGKKTITDRLGDFTFHISAQSFFQVNTRQAELLYRKAVEYAALTGKETVVDAYCGTGTISLFLAQRAAKVYGVEIVAPAIRDARKNAADNRVDNIEFIVGDATEVMPALYQKGVRPDVIVVDPPRAGCDARVLETFARMEPKRMVYVSCNPASLARDLARLKELGYQTEQIQPVDMFSQTSHVEAVVLLSKGEIDSKEVRVEFSLEDMDMSRFQKGATYPQIKEYVLEHTGMKVSSLYISQVKRKCGLDVGQNYNLSKKENAKQLQCPPEKEVAIMAALRYYGII